MPAAPFEEHRYDLPDEAATEAFAARFADAVALWHAGAATRALQVHLHGDLGAGKTAFVRATLRALGHAGRVRSPTYTLVEPYEVMRTGWDRPLRVHHFDLYRFSDPAEWHEAGFDEYLAAGALNLIEWPEQAAGVLATPDLSLHLDIVDPGRVLQVRAFSAAGQNCLRDASR